MALVVLGVLGLVYGGFTYVSDTHTADIGSLTLSVDERSRINVPIWAGASAIAAGIVLFLISLTANKTK